MNKPTKHEIDQQERQMMADGAAAGRILEDEAFKKACERTEKSYVASMCTGDTAQEREIAHQRWNALKDVIADLDTVMQWGEVASEQRRDKQRSKKLDRVFRAVS